MRIPQAKNGSGKYRGQKGKYEIFDSSVKIIEASKTEIADRTTGNRRKIHKHFDGWIAQGQEPLGGSDESPGASAN